MTDEHGNPIPTVSGEEVAPHVAEQAVSLPQLLLGMVQALKELSAELEATRGELQLVREEMRACRRQR